MQFKKIFTIIFVICIFIAFTSFEIIRKSDNAILNIVTPNIIEVDLNGNNISDSDEPRRISEKIKFNI